MIPVGTQLKKGDKLRLLTPVSAAGWHKGAIITVAKDGEVREDPSYVFVTHPMTGQCVQQLHSRYELLPEDTDTPVMTLIPVPLPHSFMKGDRVYLHSVPHSMEGDFVVDDQVIIERDCRVTRSDSRVYFEYIDKQGVKRTHNLFVRRFCLSTNTGPDTMADTNTPIPTTLVLYTVFAYLVAPSDMDKSKASNYKLLDRTSVFAASEADARRQALAALLSNDPALAGNLTRLRLKATKVEGTVIS